MKDEDIKLPKMISLVNSVSWNNDIEEYARQAVRMNMPAAQPKPSDPEPFDLARAMAGEPIVTRDGRKARFVAHIQEAVTHRVVAFIDGESMAINFTELGRLNSGDRDCHLDLLMAPKPKRTVWVNVWPKKGGYYAGAHSTEEDAVSVSKENGEYSIIAHPIEIDA